MGMLTQVAELLLCEQNYKKIEGRLLTIGRQDIFLSFDEFKSMLALYGFPPPVNCRFRFQKWVD
jgi:hypothetical protein